MKTIEKNKNRKIFIYGAGHVAGKFWNAFKYYIHTFGGFLVSDDQHLEDGETKYEYRVLKLSSVMREDDFFILIAAATDNSDEMEENVKNLGIKAYARLW